MAVISYVLVSELEGFPSGTFAWDLLRNDLSRFVVKFAFRKETLAMMSLCDDVLVFLHLTTAEVELVVFAIELPPLLW